MDDAFECGGILPTRAHVAFSVFVAVGVFTGIIQLIRKATS